MGHPQDREVTDAWLLVQEASGSLVQFLRKRLQREFPTKVWSRLGLIDRVMEYSTVRCMILLVGRKQCCDNL